MKIRLWLTWLVPAAVGIASDGLKVREEAVRLSEELTSAQVQTWLRANSPFANRQANTAGK